ncbi:hypothetical protein [Paenibacillus sp.]|uniref:hypothetical protein n=1 Tax=Paenibacillus sp. TaxID=58172 RepID=UPI00281219DE|nr:hypothetical protein [Paenibacillus sp.]
MTAHHPFSGEELTISRHAPQRWLRREGELARWVDLPKLKRSPKQLVDFGCTQVDEELLPALQQLWGMNVKTEFSCAGVSLKDEPEDHSLYAYVTVLHSKETRRFVEFLMDRMRHRILITFEPERNRYDLSSFFIAHNRSFCFLLAQYARRYALGLNQ